MRSDGTGIPLIPIVVAETGIGAAAGADMICGCGTEPNDVDGVETGNTGVGIVSPRRHGHARPRPTASTAAAAISFGLRGTTARPFA